MTQFRRSTNPAVASFRPIGNKTLARRLTGEKIQGGVIIPDIAVSVHMAEFEILACGPKCEVFAVGDHAIMPRQLTFSHVEIGGETFEIVPEDQFQAKVDNASAA